MTIKQVGICRVTYVRTLLSLPGEKYRHPESCPWTLTIASEEWHLREKTGFGMR